MVPWLSRCALRLWRELVAVLLGKGSELLLYPRIRRRCQKVVHPRGGEDDQHPGRLRPRVRGLVDGAPRHHHERARWSRDLARLHPHGQLSLQNVEGLVVVTVDVRPGPRRAGWDRVVVDRVAAPCILVADLDDHPPADRFRWALPSSGPTKIPSSSVLMSVLLPAAKPRHKPPSGSLCLVFLVPYQRQNDFFDLLAARVGESCVLARDLEPAFFQDSDRGYVVFGSIPGHVPVEEYGLFCDGLVAQDPGPARREGIPVRRVPRRECGHAVCVRVKLLLEEYGEVLFRHVPQQDFARQRARCASGHVALPGSAWPPGENYTATPEAISRKRVAPRCPMILPDVC